MNWLSKIDSLLPVFKEMAVAHWEVAFILPLIIAIFSIVLTMKNDSLSASMRTRARVFRYCHSCPFCDLHTETCSLYADDNEKCGLIDKTTGMTFTVTKDN